MTYFECVTILDELINLPLEHQKLEQIKNANISLEGDRYYRFLVQILYLLKERYRILEERLITRFYDKTHSSDELTLELNELSEEYKYSKKIINMKHIKKEDYSDLLKKITQMNNDLVNVLSDMFDDNMYKTIIEGYIIEESENNEL